MLFHGSGNFGFSEAVVKPKFRKFVIGRFLILRKNGSMDIQTIKQGLAKTGKTKSGLAKTLGIQNSGVSDLLRGDRRIRADEVAKIERYLELDRSVPIVGIVQAGGEAHYHEPSDLGRAKPIFGSGPNTVAVEIQGNSLGADFDGWIAYYDELHNPPSTALYGQLCVVGLTDGRKVVKTLRPTRRKRFFHLSSSNSETIFDVEVEWAARVIDIKPRDLAVIA